MGVPFADAHGHTNPVRGLGAEKVAKRFREAGGWFMALVALSPTAYGMEPTSVESYVRVVDEILINECRTAEEAGLRVACLAGFHPAEVDKLIDRYKMDPMRVLELGLSVVERMEKLCLEGVLDGIGEVGRQHYKTTAERVLISQIIMERALQAVKDHECMVHLHLENAGIATVDLTDIAVRRIGASRLERVVFHHSKPVMVERASELGYAATLPGVERLMEHAVRNLKPVFMVESDYIDDPARPGAVVYPWDMALTQERLLRRKLVDEEYRYKINVDNVVRSYGVEPP